MDKGHPSFRESQVYSRSYRPVRRLARSLCIFCGARLEIDRGNDTKPESGPASRRIHRRLPVIDRGLITLSLHVPQIVAAEQLVELAGALRLDGPVDLVDHLGL